MQASAEQAAHARPGQVPRNRGARGFGLLEALVAMVILGSSGLMLFAWINQNLATASRIKQAEARAQIRLEAQSWLLTLNPALLPEGEQDLAGIRISWRSDLIEPMRDEFNYGGNLIPRWQLGLYRLHVQARRGGDAPPVEWDQILAGWKLRPGYLTSVGEGAKR